MPWPTVMRKWEPRGKSQLPQMRQQENLAETHRGNMPTQQTFSEEAQSMRKSKLKLGNN